MKTRAQIYSHEASGILRDISTYGVLTQKQIIGLYPQKDEQIKNLLSYLCKQKRLFLVDGFYSLTPELPKGRDRDYDNLEMKQILDVVCAYLMMDDNGLLCNVYNTTELGEEDVTKLFVMDQDMFPGWLEEHQNALETMSDF